MTEAPTLELSTPPSLLKLFGGAVLARKAGMRRGDSLPALSVRQRGNRTDAANLAAYARICGFSSTASLPLTYPFIAAFPLQIQLMSLDRFPLPIMGIVHVTNRIVQQRAIDPSEAYDLECRLRDSRTVDKGIEFEIATTARVGSETVWECVGTMLSRLPGGPKETGPRKQPPAPLTGTREEWTIPGDLGRRYARVSGDFNPIHLTALTAKAFGFPRAIAHGMWSKARCVAALGELGTGRVEVDVRFKLPLLMPAKVAFVVDRSGAEPRFELQSAKGDKVHLSGTVRAG